MENNTLTIKNFKCFREAELSIPNLTVLVGANGVGKSTIIQSLLLIRSAWEKGIDNNDDYVKLNGPYGLSLGTNVSVLNQEADSNEISFKIEEAGKEVVNLQLITDAQEEKLELKRRFAGFYTQIGLLNDEFYYLSAERNGPRISQKMKPLAYNHVGVYGEHTSQILAEKYLKIDDSRRHPQIGAPYLPAHVNAWMNEIFPGIELTSEKSISMQTSQIKIRNRVSSDYVESTNIGFGISYALPIIVQGLVAEKGRYFIVENPEAHLHPAAQTEIGKFLAFLGGKGLRVIIETHSDHLLDGIQLFLTEHKEMRNDVIIYNFNIGEDAKTMITPIEFNNDIEYTEWPNGFMDQTNKNYAEFVQKVRS